MIVYRVFEPPYDVSFIAELHQLCKAVFGHWDRDDLAWRLARMPDVSVHVASVEEMIAFKIGYALAPTRYYSWLGGVHTDYRRQGIGGALAEHQHQWTRTKGYTTIETTLVHDNRPMLELNLRAGLEVVGTCVWNGRMRVLMAREL